MKYYNSKICLQTQSEDILDITSEVKEVIKKSKVKNGLACIFVKGSTGAITTIEYEPGLIKDLPDALERIAPKNIYYKHHETWNDGNGHSHVRASIVGCSLTLPVVNGDIPLGTWQQIVFLELDIRPRNRELIVQVMGEE
jgi:secondary thiamine-phosphate synthase enzyme